MTLFSFILIVLSIALPSVASEGTLLAVTLKSDKITERVELGVLSVEGGVVKLTASREGRSLVVQATGMAGNVVGRAESPVGVTETPIYVTTPKGLKKLTILWKGP